MLVAWDRQVWRRRDFKSVWLAEYKVNINFNRDCDKHKTQKCLLRLRRERKLLEREKRLTKMSTRLKVTRRRKDSYFHAKYIIVDTLF